ncbi:hypothetical protein VT85_10040 [Planctomyces sp. SH-PL62]|nr:hypothetical protein VT85_10040 [Planctomyces sp. SH-PL62]
MRRFATGRAFLLLLSGLWTSIAPAEASPYKITDLGGPDGRIASTVGLSLNERGQVAGAWAEDRPSSPSAAYESHPYFYDPTAGGKVTLPAVVSPSGGDPGGYDGRYLGHAFSGLDDAGRAVAGSRDGAVSFDSATGRFTDVAGPAGFLSNSGVMIGTKEVEPIGGWGNFVPVSSQDGRVSDLGLPPGAVGAQVQGINDVGDVLVRAAMSPGEFNRYFVLSGSGGTWTDLGSSTGTAINDQGVVAGNLGFDAQGRPSHAALIAPGGATTDLGTLPGDAFSYAYGINNLGHAVGLSYAENANWLYRGFLYRDGTMTNLNDLIDPASGWSIRWGLAINDRGQILALGVHDDREGVVLLTPDGLATSPDPVFPEMPETPVPEPSSLLVFGGLALGLGVAQRRRRA